MNDGSDLRTKLVTAAFAKLEAEGGEPSLRAVARAVGVSAMTPYQAFANKRALLAAVADHGFERLARVMAEADDRPDPREALVAQGVAFVAFAQEHPALFRLMYGADHGNAATEAVMATFHILANRVASIVPDQASAATLACRSLAQGMATIALSGRLGASQSDIAVAFRLLVDGLSRPDRA